MTVVAENLAKSFGKVKAVDDLSFTLADGRVTGFLGPNGAGKSTAMRLMLGLDRGAGRTLFDGKPLRSCEQRSQVVGAHLDAKAFHPSRTARDHLRLTAIEAGIGTARVDEVIEMLGLREVAEQRPGTFSLGMGQRLGLAAALLAEPRLLMLDEPANGLDPQSIHWLREFLRHYVTGGRSVFVSSHLLSEMQLLADDIVVIAAGRLRATGSMAEFVASNDRAHVRVRVSDPQLLAAALAAAGLAARVDSSDPSILRVDDATTDQVGAAAFEAGVQVRELTAVSPSLEQVFLDLTSDDQQFATGGGTTA